jgi:hypothetical protein
MRLLETSRDFMDFRIFRETSEDFERLYRTSEYFQTSSDFNAEVSAVSP